jgi:hypothetical protein
VTNRKVYIFWRILESMDMRREDGALERKAVLDSASVHYAPARAKSTRGRILTYIVIGAAALASAAIGGKCVADYVNAHVLDGASMSINLS